MEDLAGTPFWGLVVMIILLPLFIWLQYKYRIFDIFDTKRKERFRNPDTKVRAKCPVGYKQCPSGDCIDESDPHQACPMDTDAY
jgi:hypothetical protein